MGIIDRDQKTALLLLAESVLEKLEAGKLTRVALTNLAELPQVSGVYFATTADETVLYVGKASDFTDRCRLSIHHKLSIAIKSGAVFLHLAITSADQAWHVEQWLIDRLSPPLNEKVSQWWTAEKKPTTKIRPKCAAALGVVMPATRISAAPLPEFHDRMLTLWSWGKRRSRSAMATHLIEEEIEERKDWIFHLIESAAKLRGITYEEMEALILANPKYDMDQNDSKDEEP